MSERYEQGRDCARSFLKAWEEFEKESLDKVVNDLAKGHRGKRVFRFTNASKVRFVAGIVANFLKHPTLKLSNSEYARLCGISVGTFGQLIKMDPSLRLIVEGEETKEGLGPRKPGPPAKLVCYQISDIELKQRLATDAEFDEGFVDEFTERVTSKEFQWSSSTREFGDELMWTYRSRSLVSAFKAYTRFLSDLRERIRDFCNEKTDPKRHPEFNPAYHPAYSITDPSLVQNSEKAVNFLTALCEETRAAMRNLRRGKISRRLVRLAAEDDIDGLINLAIDIRLVAGMLYFVLPKVADEFVQETEFFKKVPD